MLPGKSLKLELRLIIAFTVCMLCLTLSIGVGTSWWINKIQTTMYQTESEALANTLANQARLSFLFDSNETAEELLQLFQDDQDIDHVWLITEERTVLAQLGPLTFTPAQLKQQYQTWQTQPSTSALLIRRPVFESEQIGAEQIGEVYILFNLNRLTTIKRNIIVGVFVVATIMTIPLLLLVIVISKQVSQPLVEFISGLELIKNYERLEYSNRNSYQEILQLHHSFDSLMNRLEDQRDKLKRSYEQLIEEKNYKERAEREKIELEKRLLQSQKMESIGQLTSGIAHDFNNILGSILGFSELAIETLEYDEEMRDVCQYIKEVNVAGNRAKTIVSKLLAFARESQHDPKPIVISKEMGVITTLMRPMLPSSITIDNQIAPDDARCTLFDPVEFSQVIMNLCINAKDAIGISGKITISMQEENLEETLACSSCSLPFSGEYLVITVEDSGPGISQSLVNKLFQPFYTTKEMDKGSGLGLSMVHGVVHQKQGHIFVESELNHYTRFKLYLKSCSPATVSKPEAILKERSAPLKEQINLVVVDDDQQFLAFLTTVLEENGCTVFSTSEPQEAVDYITNHEHLLDLVLTDEIMPKMTGLEIIAQLHEIGINIPTIVCSGYSKYASADYQHYTMFKKLLKKPVEIDELLDSIIEVLSQQSDRMDDHQDVTLLLQQKHEGRDLG